MDRPFSFVLIWECLPYFFGSKANHGSHQPYERGKDFIHGGLRTSSQEGIIFFRIEAVFQYIQVDG